MPSGLTDHHARRPGLPARRPGLPAQRPGLPARWPGSVTSGNTNTRSYLSSGTNAVSIYHRRRTADKSKGCPRTYKNADRKFGQSLLLPEGLEGGPRPGKPGRKAYQLPQTEKWSPGKQPCPTTGVVAPWRQPHPSTGVMGIFGNSPALLPE